MKKVLLGCVAPCALVTSLLLIVATPSGAATTVLSSQVRGVQAYADFESVDGSGCVVTDVGVTGQNAPMSKNSSIPAGAVAFVTVSEFDQCTQTDLVEAFG